jgi:hypothetical protein
MGQSDCREIMLDRMNAESDVEERYVKSSCAKGASEGYISPTDKEHCCARPQCDKSRHLWEKSVSPTQPTRETFQQEELTETARPARTRRREEW